MKRIILFAVFCVGVINLQAQVNSRGTLSQDLPPTASYEEKYLSGDNQKSAVVPKRKFKKTYLYWFFDHHEKLRDDFYKRRKKVIKKYRKQNKLLEKPQYSNPRYFGHKRKPKIRPDGKRKFCKECGITH